MIYTNKNGVETQMTQGDVDRLSKEKNKEFLLFNDLACAAHDEDKDVYFVKLDTNGFLYDSLGLYANDGDLTRVDPYKDKKIFDWSVTTEYVYSNYVTFLKNRSKASLLVAQTQLNNSQKVQYRQVFKRSGK